MEDLIDTVGSGKMPNLLLKPTVLMLSSRESQPTRYLGYRIVDIGCRRHPGSMLRAPEGEARVRCQQCESQETALL